jgi:hypothetical protein
MGDQAVDRQADTQPIWSSSQGKCLGKHMLGVNWYNPLTRLQFWQSACWTPDGANLFYSLRGEDELRMIYFNKASSGIGKTIAVW